MAITTQNAMKPTAPDMSKVQTFQMPKAGTVIDKNNFDANILNASQKSEIAKLKGTDVNKARELALKYANYNVGKPPAVPPATGGFVRPKTETPAIIPKTGTDSSVNRLPQIQSNVANIGAQHQEVLGNRDKFDQQFGYSTADAGKKAVLDQMFTSWNNLYGNVQNPNNPNASEVADTLGAIKKTAEQVAAEQAAAYTAGWAAQAAVIKEANKELEARSGARREGLEGLETDMRSAATEAKGRYDDILRMANANANRDANIAAANAGESGLQFSAGDIAAIKQDETAKAWTAIQNAMKVANDGRFSVTKDMIENIKGLKLSQQQEDKLLETLLGKDYAPIVEGIQKGTSANVEWDKAAADAQLGIQKGTAEEQANRMNRRDRIDSDNNEYANASPQMRATVLREKISSADYGIGPALAAMITADELNDIVSRSNGNLVNAIAMASQLATDRQAKLTASTTLAAQWQGTIDTNKFLSDFMNGTGPFAKGGWYKPSAPAANPTQSGVRNMGAKAKNVPKAKAPAKPSSTIKTNPGSSAPNDARKSDVPVMESNGYRMYETMDGRYRLESPDGRTKVMDKKQFEDYKASIGKIPK